MDECKPLVTGVPYMFQYVPAVSALSSNAGAAGGRGLHLSTFQLNLSRF